MSPPWTRPQARASPTQVERTKTPYLPSRVKPFLYMWFPLYLRTRSNHCAHPYSDLVAERKFHGLKVLYIWDRMLPYVPGYPHRGLLGMSIQRCDQAFQEVHGPGFETVGLNGENWRAQWFNHRLQMSMDCSSGTRFQRRRWESRLTYQPTIWTVVRAKSVLYFLFAYFYDLSTVFPWTVLVASRPNTRNRYLTKRNSRGNSMYRLKPFDDDAYFGLIEKDTIPIHYLHDQEDTIASDDPIVA